VPFCRNSDESPETDIRIRARLAAARARGRKCGRKRALSDEKRDLLDVLLGKSVD